MLQEAGGAGMPLQRQTDSSCNDSGHESHRNKKGGHEAHLGFILLSI